MTTLFLLILILLLYRLLILLYYRPSPSPSPPSLFFLLSPPPLIYLTLSSSSSIKKVGAFTWMSVSMEWRLRPSSDTSHPTVATLWGRITAVAWFNKLVDVATQEKRVGCQRLHRLDENGGSRFSFFIRFKSLQRHFIIIIARYFVFYHFI